MEGGVLFSGVVRAVRKRGERTKKKSFLRYEKKEEHFVWKVSREQAYFFFGIVLWGMEECAEEEGKVKA